MFKPSGLRKLVWRLYLREGRVVSSAYKPLVGRLCWYCPGRRVSGIDQRLRMRCAWCEQVQRTSLHEVWSELLPDGHLVRLCDNCAKNRHQT